MSSNVSTSFPGTRRNIESFDHAARSRTDFNNASSAQSIDDGEPTASPARHAHRDYALVHPVIQQQLGPAAAMNSAGITTFPPVTVTAEQVHGEQSSQYLGFISGTGAATPPPYMSNVDEIPQEGGGPILDIEAILRSYDDFNALPPELQNMILSSPTAASQMMRFFAAGGEIEFDPNIGITEGTYEVKNGKPTITLSANGVQAAGDGNNDAYENGLLMGVLGHELGHWSIGSTRQFTGDTLSEYLHHRAVNEALANVNAMVIAGEIEYYTNYNPILSGYATDANLAPLYEAFQQSHDLDALTDGVTDLVKDNDDFVDRVTNYWNEHPEIGG